MTETTTAPAEAAVASPKKGKAGPAKKKTGAAKTAKASHPPTAQMVNAAIKILKERGGSSLQAIKKYISATYKVDAEKLSPFIRKYIKNAVDSGNLVRTKGKGASGSFKLPGAEGTVRKPKSSPKKPKKTVAKKPAAVKKASPKKPAAPKAKTVRKPPTTPKAPKPKKAKAAPKAKKPAPKAKKASPKKAAKKSPKKK